MKPKSNNSQFQNSAVTYDSDVRANPTCMGSVTKGRALSNYEIYEEQKRIIGETSWSCEEYDRRIAELTRKLDV